MKKSNKIKIVILVLIIALVGAIVLLGTRTKNIGNDDINVGSENVLENSASPNKTKQSSDAKKKNKEQKINKSNKKAGPDPMEKKHGKKKDIGGGLYEYEDGTIETEILP